MNPVWTAQYDPGVPPHLTYPDLTLPDLLARAAETYPTRPAIFYYGRCVPYRRLDGLANQFAHAILRLNAPGGVVGIMLPNLPQTVIAYFGALRAGAAVTAINPLSVEREIEHQIVDAGCETLVALDPFFPRIESLLGRTCLKRVVLTGPEAFLPGWKRMLYRWTKARPRLRPRGLGKTAIADFSSLLTGSTDPPRMTISPDAVALLQYTGGTTGTPKGVVLSHRNLVANAWQCRHWMPSLREGKEVFLAVLPFFHVYGMSACQNLAVGVAAALTILPRFQAREVLATIARRRVTVFPGIPAMYATITHHETSRRRLRSLRLCISGAGPLLPSVQERFEALTGSRLVEGYGLTEAGPVTHVNPVGSSTQRRPRSIGLPLPDTDAKIMDLETGRTELPTGLVGELVVRGPQVMQGYWKREEETRHVLREGWLYTGDLARRDEDGFFYLEGRKKDMIKSGGENVYPREVEDVLNGHGKVKEAVVVGLPQGLRGELIKAYVVLEEGKSATAAELLEHCRTSLARFKVPKKIEFRSELPKTAVGKVLRRVLVEEEQRQGPHDQDDPG